jgi:hypothetical protein
MRKTPSRGGDISTATWHAPVQRPTSSARLAAASDTKPKIKSERKIMSSKLYYTIELSVDADLENVVTDEEASKFADAVLADLEAVIKSYSKASNISVSMKLSKEIMDWKYGGPAYEPTNTMEDHGTP